MQVSKIKRIIKENDLVNPTKLIHYLKQHIGQANLLDLEQIAELANGNRQSNSAFYTDQFIVKRLIDQILLVHKSRIKILEPAVGIGNFIIPFIKHMMPHYDEITVDVNDIDPYSIKILKLFIKHEHFPSKVKIHYLNHNFLSGLTFQDQSYDYVIGNPPFKRISVKKSKSNGYPYVTNLSGEFLLKAESLGRIVAMVMPKNLLSTRDYVNVRSLLAKDKINKINDFGEYGFKGVLIETIGITITTDRKPSTTLIDSMVTNDQHRVKQSYITDPTYPTWLIYRNSFFDRIASYMKFNIFTVFRDRQITNRILSKQGSIRVIKSRNIARDGSKLIKLPNYDAYINKEYLPKLTVRKFYKNQSVYLVPNMTYYPRIIKKNGDFIVNGSVAILIPKNHQMLNQKQINFINSSKFQEFYSIARNKSTRSLNIDKSSVFWFGAIIK